MTLMHAAPRSDAEDMRDWGGGGAKKFSQNLQPVIERALFNMHRKKLLRNSTVGYFSGSMSQRQIELRASKFTSLVT
jgi:hypothetical protein